MTQKDLAVLLGVTPATVSKAVKGAPDISAATRERVLAAMEAHGMKIERERRTQGRAVLVVTPEFGSEYYAQMLSCLHRALAARGLTMLTISMEQDYRMGSHPVKQVLRTTSGICGAILIDFENNGCPYCEPDFVLPMVYLGTVHDCVKDLYADALHDAVRYLKAHGRRRIAFAGEKLTLRKSDSFRQVMECLAPPVDERYIHVSALRFEQAGADGFAALFSLPEPPDAIICAYDYIALGVLNAAEAAGIEGPRELAVIGADNVRAAGAYRLGLSTIGGDPAAVADALVELLLWRIAHPDAPERKITVPSELYLRGTS